MTILHTFVDLWNFLGFENWESGIPEIPRNGLVWTNFDILGIFPTQFRPLSLMVKSEFQNSNSFWNLKIGNREVWKLPEMGWFGPILTFWVYFPLNLGYWAWLWCQNFKMPILFEIWKLEIGNSGNSQKWAGLVQFWHFGYISQIV